MPTEKDYRDELESKLKVRDKKIDALTDRVNKLEKQVSELTGKGEKVLKPEAPFSPSLNALISLFSRCHSL